MGAGYIWRPIDLLRTVLRSFLLGSRRRRIPATCVQRSDEGLDPGPIGVEVARLVGGGGGGKAHLATAGGKDAGALTGALGKVPDIVRSMIQ